MAAGCLPPDPVALASMPAAAGFTASLTPIPALDRSNVALQPMAHDNIDYPNCTVASLTETARGFAALRGWDLNVAPGAPLSFFASCVNIPLADDAALRGCPGARLADIAAIQCCNGYDIGPQRLSGAVATVPLERRALAYRMAAGPLWVSGRLTRNESDGPVSWIETAGGTPNEGHAFMLWDYEGLGDNDWVRISTWGIWVRATWGWLLERLQEAHLLWLPQVEDGPAIKEMAQASAAWATNHAQTLARSAA